MTSIVGGEVASFLSLLSSSLVRVPPVECAPSPVTPDEARGGFVLSLEMAATAALIILASLLGCSADVFFEASILVECVQFLGDGFIKTSD